jgi:hypothetical protein
VAVWTSIARSFARNARASASRRTGTSARGFDAGQPTGQKSLQLAQRGGVDALERHPAGLLRRADSGV